ncbi:hypothetical protein N7G274_008369 [Stereocaulon virgatum]|uniref:Uncharacterized protein n=1 Tax=Stereocaulon virgatum TaxID=373712 RepID=A0ABR3ZYS0_9LECA
MASGQQQGNNGRSDDTMLDLDIIISNAIARFLRENQIPQGPPGRPASPRLHGSYWPQSPRFNPGDIGFLDPFYGNKSADTGPTMEHTGKETFFRDVIVFIDRIKDVARAKGTELRNVS